MGARSEATQATRELTDASRRDGLAGTPWHKHLPTRIEPAPARAAG